MKKLLLFGGGTLLAVDCSRACRSACRSFRASYHVPDQEAGDI